MTDDEIWELELDKAASAPRSRGGRFHGLRFSVATGIAFAGWLVTVCFSAIERTRLVHGVPPIVAVHGEWANRTRHVLELVSSAPTAVQVIVLGRPRTALGSFRRMMQDRFPGQQFVMVRPFSLAAAIEALRLIPATLGRGRELSRSRRTPFRELCAITYRVMLGITSAQWWRRQSVAGEGVVIYGHTGLADTSMLERAQQASGLATVHVVHGLRTGINFAGVSSVGVFRSGSDASFYAALPGYRRVLSFSMVRPAARRGDGGWLLLTNLAHPMNPGYRARGIADEIEALRATVAAGQLVDVRPDQIAWKPHPVVSQLPQRAYEELMSAARSLGVQPIPPGSKITDAGRYAAVVSTHSTVIVDLMSEGILPVLLETRPADTESALSSYPVRAIDGAALAAQIRSLRNAEDYAAAFARAWDRIQPARFPTLEELLAIDAHPQHVRVGSAG